MKRNLMKEAHKLTKQIVSEYGDVDYMTQLGLCLSFLSQEEGERRMKKVNRMKKISKKYEPVRENILKNIEEYRSKINNDYAYKKIVAKFNSDKEISTFKINNLIKKELHYFDLLEQSIKYEWGDYDFNKFDKAFSNTTDYEVRMKNVANLIKWNICSLFEYFNPEELKTK